MKKFNLLILIIIAVACSYFAYPQPLSAQEEVSPGVAKQGRVPGKGSHKGWETGKHKGWGKGEEKKIESEEKKTEKKEQAEERALKEKKQEAKEMKRMPDKAQKRIEKESPGEGRQSNRDKMEHGMGHTGGAGRGRGGR